MTMFVGAGIPWVAPFAVRARTQLNCANASASGPPTLTCMYTYIEHELCHPSEVSLACSVGSCMQDLAARAVHLILVIVDTLLLK